MINKEIVREAVGFLAGLKDNETDCNILRIINILQDLAEQFLSGKIGYILSQDEITNLIGMNCPPKMCAEYNKELHNIAEALAGDK